MHPILARKERLFLYMAAWAPVSALLAGLLVFVGRMGWAEAAILAIPMTLVYSFLCLSAWYLVRSFPLQKTAFLKLVGVYAVAAALSGSLWTMLGRASALGLACIPAYAGIEEHYRAQSPLLMGIGALIFILAAAGHYLLSAIESSREAERGALELQVLARDAELRALRAQINPHFLFNSLNSISALTTIDPAAARAMCQLLAEFLRKSIDTGEKDRITLDEEFVLVSSFLGIEKARLGSRLRILQEIDETSRACLLPPLLLQPLIENAIRHGVAQLLDGGEIHISAARLGDRLRITVENPCDPDRTRDNGRGIGLANVRGRLINIYGREAWLEVDEREERYRVAVSLPATEKVTHEAMPDKQA